MTRWSLVVAAFFCSLAAAAPAHAGPGALNVLVAGNGNQDALATALTAEPGIASATAFDTSTGTPTPAQLAGMDLVVSTGDSTYDNSVLWGDRLADYVDGGGAVLQTAYDNWDDTGGEGPAPRGRFASGGYPPLLLGPNDNVSVTLGTLLVSAHPLLDGLAPGSFPSGENTNTPLAPGATSLALWSNGSNAIAVKNRVVATSASPGDSTSLPAIARLARNTGNYFGAYAVTVTKSGSGSGIVTGSPAGISCGSTCSQIVPFGSSISLTPTAAANSRFAGWTGACTGTGGCIASIAGSAVSVGAAFQLAAFGSGTGVALSAASTRISGGSLRTRVRNDNDFSLAGTLAAATVGKVNVSALRRVKLKSKPIAVGAKSTQTISLNLGKQLRQVMKSKRKLKLAVTATVKDPAGNSRKVTKRITLRLKAKKR